MKRKTALTIAGSDPSGGAGIQADLKTMMANGVYGMSALTALTVQNTMGVTGVMEVTSEFLAQQIDAVFDDIRPDAVKTGMVASAQLISVIAERLKAHDAANIVVDPVMVSTSGSRLLAEDAVETLKAEVLTGIEITGREDMQLAAEILQKSYGCAVLCKGGHSVSDADDLLYVEGRACWLPQERINNPNTHGTGCTLSSAIASNLAKGMDLEGAVAEAKAYLTGALMVMMDLGKGSGPVDHAFDLSSRFI